ncbi:hypothetical protein LINPERPRIM_LOCUS45326 [Linum perenne]
MMLHLSNKAPKMSTNSESQVSLKLLIDKQTRKLVYGEAGKEFVDLLLTILSLPLGTVTMLLSKNNMVGCLASLGSLYQSIENLNDTYIIQSKSSILNPEALYSPTKNTTLLSTDGLTGIRQFYTCSNTLEGVLALGRPLPSQDSKTSITGIVWLDSFPVHRPPPLHTLHKHTTIRMTEDSRAICPDCNKPMDIKIEYHDAANSKTGGQEGGFVKGAVIYMIMDNLEVKPMSTVSIVATLNKFNIKDVGALEEKVIRVSSVEGMKILKASLTTDAVLSTVFLGA